MSTFLVPTTAAPPDTATRPRRRPPVASLRRWVSPVLAIALWQAASSTGLLDPRDLRSPVEVAQTAWTLIQNGTLGQETLVSVRRVALGLAIGLSLGVTLALLAGLGRIADDGIDPIMQSVRTLPHLGLVPLFIMWMGVGETPKIALVALGAVFPIYLNTLAGIRGIDRKTIEAADSMGLTWPQKVRHVVLPGALPQALTGLRQSLGIAWLTIIVAETIASDSGLGYLINHARDFLQTDVIVVGLVVYALLGLATDGVVRLLERKALAWRV